MIRERDGNVLQHLFRDILLSHYEALLDNNSTHDFIIPDELYSTIAHSIDFAEDIPRVEIYSLELLYLV